eukprot:Opistho-2@53549
MMMPRQSPLRRHWEVRGMDCTMGRRGRMRKVRKRRSFRVKYWLVTHCRMRPMSPMIPRHVMRLLTKRVRWTMLALSKLDQSEDVHGAIDATEHADGISTSEGTTIDENVVSWDGPRVGEDGTVPPEAQIPLDGDVDVQGGEVHASSDDVGTDDTAARVLADAHEDVNDGTSDGVGDAPVSSTIIEAADVHGEATDATHDAGEEKVAGSEILEGGDLSHGATSAPHNDEDFLANANIIDAGQSATADVDIGTDAPSAAPATDPAIEPTTEKEVVHASPDSVVETAETTADTAVGDGDNVAVDVSVDAQENASVDPDHVHTDSEESGAGSGGDSGIEAPPAAEQQPQTDDVQVDDGGLNGGDMDVATEAVVAS